MHLEVGDPEYVKVFPDFQPMPAKCPRISKEENQSKFAYSSPFQVFSQEGLKVLKNCFSMMKDYPQYFASANPPTKLDYVFQKCIIASK